MNYNAKWQKSLPMMAWKKAWIILLNSQDAKRDRRICGTSLVKYKNLTTDEVHASQPSHYRLLEQVFRKAKFTAQDAIIDVGCGKGRILAYLTEQGVESQLTGVELNQEVIETCKQWTRKYPNIHIVEGNVLDMDLTPFSVMVMANPFGTSVLLQLLEKIERELRHPLTLYYIYDHVHGNTIDHRPGWTLKHRGWIWRDGCYYLAYSPQRCSLWQYSPSNVEA